ncbi:hypothetical protein [Methanosarcina lacustris]|uniref:hypothetical protein n=1 Tax=Methanosarcina lacustris TaxID=170861 RepID=UPI000AB5FD63|nr:hypothetical protein [Methanosarcina lacustris]
MSCVGYSPAGGPAIALRSHKRKKKSAAQAQDMKKIGDVSQAARNNVKQLIMDNLII